MAQNPSREPLAGNAEDAKSPVRRQGSRGTDRSDWHDSQVPPRQGVGPVDQVRVARAARRVRAVARHCRGRLR